MYSPVQDIMNLIIDPDLRALLNNLLKKHLDDYYCETIKILGEYSFKKSLNSRAGLFDITIKTVFMDNYEI